MKKFVLSVVAAVALASPTLAADLMPVKAPPKAPEPPPWDIAFGGGLATDYIFRGITQSNHRPSVSAYFEPRYNFTKEVQVYAGISGSSISFPNRAAAEIDIYGGIRPTFGPVALDLGGIYYYYPGGQCFHFDPTFGLDCLEQGPLPVNGNVVKRDLSFFEAYAKGTFTVNDQLAFSGGVFYSPSVLNSGADGTYLFAGAKVTAPSNMLPAGLGAYASAEVGHWYIGTSDAFYGVPAFPNGIDYFDYTTWNIGVGITRSVFTLDFRYYDTNMNKGDCNAFTSDHTARFTNDFTPINPGGFGSNWCEQRAVVKGTFDLTALTNVK
jgi:hypothetical protein